MTESNCSSGDFLRNSPTAVRTRTDWVSPDFFNALFKRDLNWGPHLAAIMEGVVFAIGYNKVKLYYTGKRKWANLSILTLYA